MKTKILISIFIVFSVNSILNAQLDPWKPSLGSRNLSASISTTSEGGLGALLSKELSVSLHVSQRFNYELTENTSISLGTSLQFSTCFPINVSSERDAKRSIGSFGFLFPVFLNYHYGCQSIVDNDDKIGFFGGIGYAIASLPKTGDGEYYNSPSLGLYPNFGVIFGFSESFKMGIKAYSILNHVQGGNPVIGLNIFFISNPGNY